MFLKVSWSVVVFVPGGQFPGVDFQAVGPACENAHSPNLVRSLGSRIVRVTYTFAWALILDQVPDDPILLLILFFFFLLFFLFLLPPKKA